jgi:hypothetical protein
MIDRIIEYKENDLSKDVIVPLLKKMFSKTRVEFVGGGIEKGKDIVIYKRDDFGFDEYIGVQVKKIKATPNSSINSFQQLLTQLEQMKNEGVVCGLTGNEIKISKLIFITPHPISEKTYDTHNSALKKVLDMGVKIIDGHKLCQLIQEHMPEAVRQITGNNEYIGQKIDPSLSNNLLMSALNFKNKRELCDIYCRANLTFGNSSKEFDFSNVSYKPNAKSYVTELRLIQDLIFDNRVVKGIINQELFDDKDLKKGVENLELHEEIKLRVSGNQDFSEKIVSEINSLVTNSEFRDAYPSVVKSKEFKDFMESSLDALKLPKGQDKNKFYKEFLLLNEKYRARESALSENLQLRIKDNGINKLIVEIGVYSATVCKLINNLLNEFKEKSCDISLNMREYLLLSKDISVLQNVMAKYPSLIVPETIVFTDESEKVKFSIEQAFDTDLNIVILGDAGSGKTTNLQMHAKRLYKNFPSILTLYVTLNELASLSLENKCLTTGVRKYLYKMGLTEYTQDDIDSQLKTLMTKLILDSIDEAVVEYNWIVDSLISFSESYPMCQIITSSRFTVEQVSNLPFVNISLMPFSNEQKSEFFVKWFKCKDKADFILNHLNQHDELNRIVNNPLSATILATLHEGEIPLPKTESNLYKKRFELMSGVFDKFKGVNRSVCEPDLILGSARYIAFKMHFDSKKEISQKQVLELIEEKYGEKMSSQIYKELISPSEILLVNYNGSVGFGHLRFQEYLASEQLNHMRSIPINKLIKNNWWNDVFILYSQHAEEISWIINDASVNEYARKISNLLSQMIRNRSNNEREKLTSRIEIALRDEKKFTP